VFCSKERQKERRSLNIFGIEVHALNLVCYTQSCDICLTNYFQIISFNTQMGYDIETWHWQAWDWVSILVRLFEEFDKIVSSKYISMPLHVR
jgi:hypothetical protein